MSFRPDYRALVIGATGAVGSALVRELLASAACTEVRALVRRTVSQFDAEPGHEKLHASVIDFARIEEETARVGAGCEMAFCTMGVGQPSRTTKEEFERVDVQYAGAFARGAKTAGARHISLLSSVGANLESRNYYLRTKGAAEAAVTSAGIERTSLFRPSVLVTREYRYGLQDVVTQAFAILASPVMPAKYHRIRVEDLARAMRVNAERAGGSGTETLHYPEFVPLFSQ